VLRIIIRSLWTHKLYALLTLLALITIGSGWIILAATLQTAQYVVDENLDLYWRTAYDLLVRPQDSVSEIEAQHRLVEPNQLGNSYEGGITREQYELIKGIAGVEVAAPVAPVGFVYGGWPSFFVQLPGAAQGWTLASGEPLPEEVYGVYLLRERSVVDNGLQRFTVWSLDHYIANVRGLDPRGEAYRRLSAARDIFYTESFQLPLALKLDLSIPLVGIDPDQEARLLGLDGAVTSGRYLRPDDRPEERTLRITFPTTGSNKELVIPVLVNGAPYLNAWGEVELYRYTLPEGVDPLALAPEQLLEAVHQLTPTLVLSDTLSPQSALQAFLGGGSPETMGPFRHDSVAGHLVSLPLSLPSPVAYRTLARPELAPLVLEAVPQGATDYGEVTFRQNRQVQPEALKGQAVRWEQVGIYDPAELGIEPDGLVDVPLELYYPPLALLKYGPDGSPQEPQLMRPTLRGGGSYLLPPPYGLVTLDTAEWLTGREDCIAGIRVRVARVGERNAISQARVEAVADEIERRTGLHVDITLGSALNRTLVSIPGWEDSPPTGYVEEGWVVKGANLAIGQETHWANLTVFVAALVTCLSAVAILMASSVLSRSAQWALLHALGWRPRAVRGLVLREAALLGAVGGLLGLGVGWLGGRLAQIQLAQAQLLAAPAATCLLCVGAALYAVRLQRQNATRPDRALRQGAASPGRRWPRVVSLWSFSLRGAIGRWGLAGLAWLALAAAVALCLLLLGVGDRLDATWGATRLGEHIGGMARGYYGLLLVVCLAVAAAAITDLMASEARRRRGEIGACLAVGWRPGHVVGVFVRQATLLGLAAGLTGSVVALALLVALTGALPAGWPAFAAMGVALALALSATSAFWPARRSTQVPPAETMRGE